MKNEVYIWASKGGGNDQAGDCMMMPASKAYGITSTSSIDAKWYFAPMDNTSTTADIFSMRDNAGPGGNPAYGDTLYRFVKAGVESTAAARVTGNNFVVLFDSNTGLPTNEGPISSGGVAEGISGALTIT